jgi:hypothetical protein
MTFPIPLYVHSTHAVPSVVYERMFFCYHGSMVDMNNKQINPEVELMMHVFCSTSGEIPVKLLAG